MSKNPAASAAPATRLGSDLRSSAGLGPDLRCPVGTAGVRPSVFGHAGEDRSSDPGAAPDPGAPLTPPARPPGFGTTRSCPTPPAAVRFGVRFLAFGLLLLFATAGQTQTLDEAIAHALAHAPDLRVLEAGVAEARASATLANPFAPAASISTTPGYATGLPIAVLGQVPAIGTVEAHRLLYDASAHAEQLTALSEVDAAVARLEARRREVAQNVAELYGRLVGGASLIASAQRRVAASETIAARTQALQKEGRARDLDVDRAILQVAMAQRREAQARARYDLDRARFSSMVGDVWAAPAQAQSPEMGTRNAGERGDVKAALTADPELRAFDVRIDALQKALVVSSAFWQPSIAAQVQYSRLFDRFGRYYNHFTPNDLSVGATVTLPLWTGGRRAATSTRVAAQLEQLKAGREARRAQLELAWSEAVTEVNEATAESNLAGRALAVAQESLRVAEELAREGRGEANDVETAEIALSDAEDETSSASAHLTAVVARFRLLRGELPHPPI